MSEKHDERNSIIMSLKLDSTRLYEKVHGRLEDYISIFAGKRTREHFSAVFKTKYTNITITEIKVCDPDTIVALDNYYTQAEDIFWYLQYTEDMPNTLEDKVRHDVRVMSKLYNTLQLYLDAELGYQDEEDIVESHPDE